MAINYQTLVEGYTKSDRADWRRVDRLTRESFAADRELLDNFDAGATTGNLIVVSKSGTSGAGTLVAADA